MKMIDQSADLIIHQMCLKMWKVTSTEVKNKINSLAFVRVYNCFDFPKLKECVWLDVVYEAPRAGYKRRCSRNKMVKV